MQLVKHLWQGFAGGPDFSRLQKLTFQLDEFQLDFTLPYSNIGAEDPPRQLNIPFRAKSWFEQHAGQNMHNFQVHIHTEGWCYLSPILRGENSELGVLWLQLALRKTPETVNALNRQQLADYVIAAYDAHYNSDTIGPEGNCQGLGWNTRQRQRLKQEAEEAAARGATGRLERLADDCQLQIKQFGYESLSPAKVISMHGFDWVFYQERKGQHATHSDIYCLPLDQDFYLTVKFNHRVDISSEKAWQKHAKKAQQDILNTLTVSVNTKDLQLALPT
ncbi:hypothetical protein ORJ04_21210 [Rheinheimera baltica]|uniref:Uncharacterized protein n=1 Tax=Rheinheimera baltica TaxID=67576 RepID=A0ABT9I4Y9_9GAMM|nr:hypothetical protein [Rheinheimera baltica]MDP5138471.1 hypothetical protein [Rheinheimera baltica]MDP5149935.1 hypothetical protein [Rheinheimera baltica]